MNTHRVSRREVDARSGGRCSRLGNGAPSPKVISSPYRFIRVGQNYIHQFWMSWLVGQCHDQMATMLATSEALLSSLWQNLQATADRVRSELARRKG